MSDDELSDIVTALGDHTTDPDRPFTGQPHTDNGERGKTEVRGIRFRDLADCVIKALIDSASHTIEDKLLRDELVRRADDGTLNYNDVYKLRCGDVDPIALSQNITCRVEKAMGIFPNIRDRPPTTPNEGK